jgi:glycogen debranching enzyme
MSSGPAASGLDDEDTKLLTLARGAMARSGAQSGAAVRDADGRTYAAGPVDLAALQLSALQVAIAMAVASGAEGFEAALVVGAAAAEDDPGLAALIEVSGGAYAIAVDAAGESRRLVGAA